MIRLWRLTRNRYARRVYDALAAAGVTATRMLEYEASTDPGAAAAVPDPDGTTVFAAPADDARLDGLDLQFSIPVGFLDGEWAVVATADGRAVGRALVSAGCRPYVAPLGERLSFDGAYVRRVYVDRDWRGQGLATRLVAGTLAVTARELDRERAVALIAADNRPSQWTFESNGFEPVRRRDYLRVFRFERRRVGDAGRGASARVPFAR